MADYRDVIGADADANAAQASLTTYCAQVEDGEREANPALVVGLVGVALCQRIEALAIRLDWLGHELQRRAR